MKPETPTRFDFEELAQESRKHDQYWVSLAANDLLEQLHSVMESAKLSRSELAKRMATSPAYISKIFRGETNFTLETMIKLARQVGCTLELSLTPEIQPFKMKSEGDFSGTSLSLDAIVNQRSDFQPNGTPTHLSPLEEEVPTDELPTSA